MKVSLKVLALCLILAATFAVSAQTQDKKLVASPNIIPPATEAMQHPEFWVSRMKGDPDRVIMTPQQITALNTKNRTRPAERTNIHGDVVSFEKSVNNDTFGDIEYHIENPLEVATFSGIDIREKLRKVRDSISGKKLYDRRRIVYQEERKTELFDSIAEDSIPDVITPRYGIIVKHTLQRSAPTHTAVYTGQSGWLDMLQKAVLETGTPVAVLHMTKNADWCYVKSDYSFGWVSADHVAFGSAKKIRSLSESDKFIVAINHKVPVFTDKTFSTHLTDFFMGARLTLAKKGAAGYEVRVPYRRADGSLDAAAGWVRPDADVSVGYQPYTRRNAIETAFRLLYRPYGWGGTGHERDCVGTVRAVFRTFGIFMSRWTEYTLYNADTMYIFPADTQLDVKYKYLDMCEPGITVCGFNWHVLLYLGKVDGVHYTIHQNGYSYHDEEGTEFRVGRVVVNHTEIEGGGDINRWTELSVYKP